MTQQPPTSPLRLRNPTPYHLMATSQQYANHNAPPHPLADIEHQQHNSLGQQQPQQFGLHTNRDSPASEQIEFNDSFSQNIMNSMSATSPNLQDYHDDNEYNNHNHMYDNRGSFSSNGGGHPLIPMDIHRRSSTATDVTMHTLRHPAQQQQQQDSLYNNNTHQPVFIPGSSLDSAHSLAMSAPANMGYDYGYPTNAANNNNSNVGGGGLPMENGSNGSIPGSTSNSTSLARSFEDDHTVQMNMQLMMEKRRRRRESHNAVERRRRDNINDRIQELCSLLPEAALENTNIGPNNKPNKGAILRKSVDHIRQLQQEVHSYHQIVEDLENTLKMYRQEQQQQNPN